MPEPSKVDVRILEDFAMIQGDFALQQITLCG